MIKHTLRYDEFMIQERKDLSKEALNRHFNSRYWNERYTVRKTFVPWFVRDAFGVTANILTTGKYLNVIRECGRPIRCPSAQSITFADRHQYVGIVGKAYEFASDTLLRLVLHESKLLDHLRSIKEFFFLSRGDLFVHFMDTASEELSKDASDIDVAKLESLLKLSLHTASTSTDPNKDNLTCTRPCVYFHHLLTLPHLNTHTHTHTHKQQVHWKDTNCIDILTRFTQPRSPQRVTRTYSHPQTLQSFLPLMIVPRQEDIL